MALEVGQLNNIFRSILFMLENHPQCCFVSFSRNTDGE